MTLILKYIKLTILLLLTAASLTAQETTTVRGTVTDKDTGEPLISASVSFAGTTVGTNTDFDGTYELTTDEAVPDTLVISYLGYETFTKRIRLGKEQNVNAKLSENVVTLEAAEVVYKEKYRNKDNPAVELIKKVIEKKEENRPSDYDYYEYEEYEKIMLGLSNLSEKFKNRKIFKKAQFLFEKLDTTSVDGAETLPIYLQETLSDVYYRKDPEKKKRVILADTMVTFEGYGANDGLNEYLDNLYQDVDIYDDNIVIIQQQFLSPVAGSAPTFYKFYIQDTLTVDGVEVIELFFAPKNKFDILFQGFIHVAYKDNYAIKQVDMATNKEISLNWVKSMNLSQTFEKRDGEGFIQTNDNFSADFGLSKDGMGIFGRRSVSNEKIKLNEPRPDAAYDGYDTEVSPLTKQADENYWLQNRHDDLSEAEAITYQKIDSLQELKAFQRAINIASILLSGYANIGENFEIGPMNTFYSFNPLEGLRLRAGGRTTLELSDRTEFEMYGAYGFKDEKFKGYFGISQALKGGNIHHFPVRRFRASVQRETAIPGQELQFVQEDNLLLSFKRGISRVQYLYNDIYRFEYWNEFQSDFSVAVGFKHWKQTPALNLTYQRQDDGQIIPDLTTAEINTVLRWAPKEQFYQGKRFRRPIYNKYPIFTFNYDKGMKGVLGGEYDYHRLTLRIFKRFFLSRLGNADVRFRAGAIFGEAAYPLLTVHPGNQTYAYLNQGFNLMNFLEFTSDRYVSLIVNHNFNGLFLNRIPLIRQMKLREVVNFRILYGTISDRNNPALNPNLIALPTDENGEPTTYSLTDKPYIEASVGLANVFKFFRIDLVKRFNYLDNPNVTDLGLRATFKVYF